MDRSAIRKAVAAYTALERAENASERAQVKLHRAVYELEPEEYLAYVTETLERDARQNARAEA